MRIPERETLKRGRQWALSDDDLRALHEMAFGKERARPVKISQATLKALLLDFNYLSHLHLQE